MDDNGDMQPIKDIFCNDRGDVLYNFTYDTREHYREQYIIETDVGDFTLFVVQKHGDNEKSNNRTARRGFKNWLKQIRIHCVTYC